MRYESRHARVLAVARRQHGVISIAQLHALGLSDRAIRRATESGRLHRVHRGIYAVGRAELTRRGHFIAAVLRIGEQAALSHASAAELWGIRRAHEGAIHVSIASAAGIRAAGIDVHRRATLTRRHITERDGIRVTTPVCTLIDIAATLGERQIEAALNELDKLGLATIPQIERELKRAGGRPGAGALRALLHRLTFRATDSELEREFLRLLPAAGLRCPETRKYVNGHRVDFYFPEQGIVVETDGGGYHRTPAQQQADRIRDQDHAAAGLVPLRFTHWQVFYDKPRVAQTLAAVARRSSSARTKRSMSPSSTR